MSLDDAIRRALRDEVSGVTASAEAHDRLRRAVEAEDVRPVRGRRGALVAAAVLVVFAGITAAIVALSRGGTDTVSVDAPEPTVPAPEGTPQTCENLTGDEPIVGTRAVTALPPGFAPDGPTQVRSSGSADDEAGRPSGVQQFERRFADPQGRWIDVVDFGAELPREVIEDAHAGATVTTASVPMCMESVEGLVVFEPSVTVSSSEARTVAGIQEWEYGGQLVIGGPDVSQDEVILVMSGLRRFDPDRPTGSPAAIDLAFLRAGSIWVRLVDGTERHVEGDTTNPAGSPVVSPDGNLIAYGLEEHTGVFWTPRIWSAADGQATAAPFISAFSPDGSSAAAIIPVDDEVPRTIEIVETATGDLVRIVTLPREVNPWTVVWDHDATGLLVVSRASPAGSPFELAELWYADLTNDDIARVSTDEDPADWIVADQARDPGTFTAVRANGSSLVLGTLTVQRHEDSPHAVFNPTATLPTGARAAPNPATSALDLYLDARTSRGGYLLGDGEQLFELTDEGELTLLMEDVTRAAAP